MFDLVYGYQPPKFQKLTGDDLEIAKLLAEGKLKGILKGITRFETDLPEPSNTNLPPKK
jgi:hypothetical protein